MCEDCQDITGCFDCANDKKAPDLSESGLNALLDCPFCGGVPNLIEIGNDNTKKRSVKIKCPGCRVERTDSALQFGMSWLKSVATKAWNMRAV